MTTKEGNMFFPVPENTRCLKMKNLQKQNFPITTYCSTSKAGKQFLKGVIGGVRRGSDFSSAFLAKKTLLYGGSSSVSYLFPWGLWLQSDLSSPKTTTGKGEKVQSDAVGLELWCSPSESGCPMWTGVRALPPSQAGC